MSGRLGMIPNHTKFCSTQSISAGDLLNGVQTVDWICQSNVANENPAAAFAGRGSDNRYRFS